MPKPNHNIQSKEWVELFQKIVDYLSEDMRKSLSDLEKKSLDKNFKYDVENYTRENAISLANIVKKRFQYYVKYYNFDNPFQVTRGNFPRLILTGEVRDEFNEEPILPHGFNAHFAWIKKGEDKGFHMHCFPEVYYCFKGTAEITKDNNSIITDGEYEIIPAFVWHKCKQKDFVGFFGKFWDGSGYLRTKIEPPESTNR